MQICNHRRCSYTVPSSHSSTFVRYLLNRRVLHLIGFQLLPIKIRNRREEIQQPNSVCALNDPVSLQRVNPAPPIAHPAPNYSRLPESMAVTVTRATVISAIPVHLFGQTRVEAGDKRIREIKERERERDKLSGSEEDTNKKQREMKRESRRERKLSLASSRLEKPFLDFLPRDPWYIPS